MAAVYGDLTPGPRAGVTWRASERAVDRRLPLAGDSRCGLRPSDFGVMRCMVPTISGHMAMELQHGERRLPAGRSDEVTTVIMGLRS